MPEDLIRITPNPERAKSILTMTETRIKATTLLTPDEFTSIITENHYEIIKELITALLAVEGYKTLSHTTLIEYLRAHHQKEFTEHEITTIDELRKTRNKITYEGFTVKKDYLQRKTPTIKTITTKLKNIITKQIK